MEQPTDMKTGNMGAKCSCPHHKAVPGLAVLFGLLFLFHAFGWVSSSVTGIVWPILVIAGGLMKMMESKCTCCDKM